MEVGRVVVIRGESGQAIGLRATVSDPGAPGLCAEVELAPVDGAWRVLDHRIRQDPVWWLQRGDRPGPSEVTDSRARALRPSLVKRIVLATLMGFELPDDAPRSLRPELLALQDSGLQQLLAAEATVGPSAFPLASQGVRGRGRPALPDDELRAIALAVCRLYVRGSTSIYRDALEEAGPAIHVQARGRRVMPDEEHVRDRVKRARARGWLGASDGPGARSFRPGPLLLAYWRDHGWPEWYPDPWHLSDALEEDA